MIETGSDELHRRGIKRIGHISGRRPDVRGLPVHEDVRREVELHIAYRIQELIEEGWEPTAAREEAERLFGSVDHIRWECEQITKEKDHMTGLTLFVQGILHDTRYAVRTLLRAPVFTSAAILSLAVGIGAGTAIFSIVNAILLRPLPYSEPERIVQVWPVQTFTKSLLENMRQRVPLLENMAAFSQQSFALTGTGEATDIYGGYVTVNFFKVLGAQPFLGRSFLPEEEAPGTPETVILSYELWQSQFGGDPGIIGRTINLSGRGVDSRTVVGIMPRDHISLQEPWRFWVPMKIDPANFSDYAGTAAYQAIGRLADGITVEQADAEVNAIARALGEEQSWLDANNVASAGVTPLRDGIIGETRTPLLLFMAAVILVLLLTCANLANILLARAGGRRREMAVRAALGAARPRLIRQVITESLVLGLAGGLLGFMTGVWFLSILKGNLPPGTPRTAGIGIDGVVLLFTAGTSILAAVLYGLAPAFATTHSTIRTVLHEGAAALSAGAGRLRWNAILIAAEIAVSVLLLVGSGLLIRSTLALQQVDPGFEVANLATFRLNPPGTSYADREALRSYYQEVTSRLSALPGVVAVSRIDHLPLTGSDTWSVYKAEGYAIPEGERMPYASVQEVDEDYFRTMGIPLLAGTVPNWTGSDPTLRELAVNRAFASLYWEGSEARGKTLEMNSDCWTITGIVGDVHQYSLAYPSVPTVYFRHELFPSRAMYVLVRTETDAADMMGPVQETVRSIDPDVPLSFLQPMAELIRHSTAQSRTATILLSFFGLTAFILALIGVLGVMMYVTLQRTREIGIRMTLGAVRSRIVSEVLWGALVPVGIGLIIGLGLALVSSRLIASLLFGVSAIDPVTYAGVALVQLTVALLACYLPARRIANTDPMVVMRME